MYNLEQYTQEETFMGKGTGMKKAEKKKKKEKVATAK